jgi:ATP-binding cassette subfamily C (CFTR/MRP) protein 1
LVSTLFRLMELTSGSIVIDGLDIATIKREELRTRLICIPQEPYLLQGCSVRLNVDPSESLADGVIVDALRKVQLWEVVTELGGLDATLTLEALSQGQRQLLCFARAMVRKAGRILVLDEATSRFVTTTVSNQPNRPRRC